MLFKAFASFLLYTNIANASPLPWQMNLQPAASPVMEQFSQFHDALLIIIFAIAAFIILLLCYTCWRFGAKRNKIPSTTTHNTFLEIIWSVVPVVIVLVIAVFSLKTLYFADRVEKSEMTLKVIGYQWYWGYEYADYPGLAFDSYIIPDKDIKPGQNRLLEVDNRVVLPIDTNIKIQITAADVIHSFAVPAFGIKRDAVPGRLNETWVKITKPGTYYGQCSELCGTGHGFMPIAIDAVTKEEFAAWVATKQKRAENTANQQAKR
jgi:cytochrome c oxidase subunit 2